MDWRLKNKTALRNNLGFLVLMLASGPLGAAEYWLCADTTVKTLPDAVSVTMWGFALDDDANPLNGCGGAVSVPGPPLTVAPTDSVLIVHLTNNLSTPVSLVIPGQITPMSPVMFTDAQGRSRVRAFTHETAPTATQTYTWSNFKPGTYAYHSGSHPAVQVQMGLYGSVVKDVAANTAYPGVVYDNALMLYYSEIDPALHAAVAGGAYGPGTAMPSTINYDPKYYLINGQAYSSASTALNAGLSGQRTLLRFLNMGLQSHVPVLQGMYMNVVAEDGNAYPYKREQYSLLLPASGTRDALVTNAASGVYPLYDRRLDLTNAGASPGGMLTYLQVASATGAPVAVADSYTVAEDTVLSVAGAGVLANDSDPNADPLSAVLISDVGSGVLNLSPDGSFTYSPELNFNGTTAFSYIASDGVLNSDAVDVTINVTPVNDAPLAFNDSYAAISGQALNVAAAGVLSNDTDVDGDVLSASLVSNVLNGTLSLNANGSFSYTANAAFTGQDSFTYSAGDGLLSSAAATVTLTVSAPVNAAPVANNDSASVKRNVGTSNNFVIINVIANDTDSDGTIDPATVNVVTLPARGSVVVNVDGSVTYTPSAGYRGSDSFVYNVQDNAGALSNDAVVRINVVR